MSHSKPINPLHSKYYDQLSTNLAYYRKKRNLSQKQLADLADTTTEYISKIESKSRLKQPSLEWLFVICDALEIQPYQLFMPLERLEDMNLFLDRPRV